MKKTLAIILSFVIICNAFILSSATESANNAELDITKELAVLSAFEIVNQIDESVLDLPVSRAAFSSYIAAMIKAEAAALDTYFIDVPSDYWAINAINALRERGIIDAAADNMFNPEDTVTYEQVCKMLVVAMGYKEYAKTIGNGMNGYIAVAKRLNMYLDVEFQYEMTMRDAVYMLYKALVTEVPYEYGFENDEVLMRVDGNSNLLGIYHNAYVEEGILRGASNQSFDNVLLDENEILVDNIRYKYDNAWKLWNFMGENVEIICKENKDTDDTVIYATSVKNEIKNITYDCVTGYSNNTLTYIKENNSSRTATVQIPRNAEILHNGRILKKGLSEILGQFISGAKKGDIKIVSGNGNERDIVVIRSYQTFIAGKYDAEEQLLYNLYERNNPIDLKIYDDVIVRSENAVQTAINTTFPAAFGVGKSDDGARIELFIYDKTETGTVASVSGSSRKKIDLAGRSAYVDKNVCQYIISGLKAGVEAKVVYDIYGEIVYAEIAASDDMNLGYICAAGAENDTFEKYLKFKIYTQNGEFMEYRLSDNVIIDGISYKNKNFEETVAAFPGGEETVVQDIQQQVIRYLCNENGEIRKIDTLNVGKNEDKKNTLTRNLDGSRLCLYSSTGSFVASDMFDANTKFFIIPPNQGNTTANEKLYSTSNSMVVNTQMYYCQTYFYKDSYLADVVVVTSEPRKESTVVYMFGETGEILGDDGEVLKSIHCWTGGAEKIFTADKDCEAQLAELTQGDLAKFYFDGTGNTVMQIDKIFDAETREFPNENGGRNEHYLYETALDKTNDWSWYQEFGIAKTFVSSVKGSVMRTSYDLLDAAAGKYNFTFNVSSTPLTVFDPTRDNDPIFKGNHTNLATCEEVSDKCDEIIVVRRYATINNIFVYKSDK